MKTYLNSEDIFWKLWLQSKILIRCFHWRIPFSHQIHVLPFFKSYTKFFIQFVASWIYFLRKKIENFSLRNFPINELTLLHISAAQWSGFVLYHNLMQDPWLAPCPIKSRYLQRFYPKGSMANTFSRLECDLTFWFCLDLTSFALIVLNTQRA